MPLEQAISWILGLPWIAHAGFALSLLVGAGTGFKGWRFPLVLSLLLGLVYGFTMIPPPKCPPLVPCITVEIPYRIYQSILAFIEFTIWGFVGFLVGASIRAAVRSPSRSTAVAVSCIILSGAALGAILGQHQLIEHYSNLARSYSDELSRLEESNRELQSRIQELSERIPRIPVVESVSRSMVIPGVDQDEGRGVLVNLSLGILPGSGRVMLDLSGMPTYPDLDSSARDAARACLNYISGIDPVLGDYVSRGRDLVYKFSGQHGAVQGGSAGAAMAVVCVAGIMNATIAGDISVTGGIDPSGRILPVGGIELKAMALRNAGFRAMIIPDQGYTPVEGISIIPVRDLDQALRYLLR